MIRLKKIVAGAGLLSMLVLPFSAGHVFGSEQGGGVSPDEALKKLMDGNARYVEGKGKTADLSEVRRQELTKGQKPFAIIVSCSDSRVAPEHLFDQGLGDLFVIRVAGNVVDQDELGSVEYAAEHLGTQLIVVLGHEKCGAVKATIDTGGKADGNIGAIVKKIAPAVAAAKKTAKGDDLLNACVQENAKKTARDLVSKSKILKHLAGEGKVKILVGEYMLSTGKVEMIETAAAKGGDKHKH
ncbi:MAG: carbonic anhydrase [Nitrospirota bacterium]|nr:carbonic anhydrase [Nitrospirota bacterium]